MADSIHKQIVDKVKALLSDIDGKLTVEANTALPEKVSDDGLIIVRDISPEPSDESYGGFDTLYMTGVLPIEVFVQAGTDEKRDIKYDELLQAISAKLLVRDAVGNRSLGGLVYGVVLDRPESLPNDVLGAASVKCATIRMHVEYSAPAALA
ncbi:MAG: hypothetical protein ACAH80_18630 [Alphaproteobacteria bacterium]